jgi:predicted DNA-binding transcriptional regulator AlpA
MTQSLPTQRRFVHTKQAAEHCGVSESMFHKRRVRGQPPAFIKLGKSVLYDTLVLDEWIDSCRRRSTSEGPDRQTPLLKVTRISPFSGKKHTMDLPITIAQLHRFEDGMAVQDVFPDLSPEQREFILTGITPEEWDEKLPPDFSDQLEAKSSARSRRKS